MTGAKTFVEWLTLLAENPGTYPEAEIKIDLHLLHRQRWIEPARNGGWRTTSSTRALLKLPHVKDDVHI